MITQFELGNFKAFGDIQRIPLTDINLIFGANSAGKSTLMQAFAYLDQAFSTLSWDVYSTRMGGEFMDLGGRQNMVHKHDPTRIMHFGITATGFKVFSPRHLVQVLGITNEVIETCSIDFEKRFNPTLHFEVTYTIRFGVNQERSYPIEYLEIIENEVALMGSNSQVSDSVNYKNRIVLSLSREGVQYRIKDINVDTLFFNRSAFLDETRFLYEASVNDILTMEYPDSKVLNDLFKNCLIESDDDQFVGFFMSEEMDELMINQFSNIKYIEWQKHLLGNSLNNIQSFFGFGKQFVDYEYPFWGSANFSKILSQSDHVGYVRPTPDRILTRYSAVGTAYAEFFNSNQSISRTNKYFKTLGIGIELRKIHYSNTSGDVTRTIEALELYDLRRNTEVSFRDIGQGIIQLIPVLLALTSSSSKDFNHSHIQFIEQPELHVHPSIESAFGKLLADLHFERKDVSGDPKRFIYVIPYSKQQLVIETHSEHLIKALQVEVARYTSTNAEEGLNPKKVAIHYVVWDETNSQSTIRTLQLDQNGSFTEPWPEDFFGISGDLSIERLRLMNKN
jgi:predicted ATPase